MSKVSKMLSANTAVTVLLALAVIGGAWYVGAQLQSLSFGASEKVDVNQHDVSASVNFPTSPTNPQVIIFEEKPEKNWGNYVDFDPANAKSGKQAGIDFHEVTSVNSNNKAVFSDVNSGKHYVYINADNYQPTFTTVDMPETVDKETYVTNDNDYKLAGAEVMRTSETYGSDNVVLKDGNGDILATGTDFPTASANETQTLKIRRTMDVDTGTALIGSYDVTSFNANDGIEVVDASITAGSASYSMELKDGASGELADSTSFGDDIVDSPDTDPAEVTGEIVAEYTVEVQRNTDVSTADDGELGPGESLFSESMDDIFGNAVADGTKSYTG